MSATFKKLSEDDQNIILAKVNHVIKNSNMGFDTALDLIEWGELAGLFNNVKFGHQEVYRDHIGIDRNGY